jgi:YVTN family beta-propeller protein
MTILDPKTADTVWSLDFDGGVTTSAFELNPDGSVHRIFSPLTNIHGFAVIDFATHKELSRVTLPPPNDFRLTGALIRRNDQPTHGNGISPDGKTLWTVSRISNGVYVHSLPDLKFVKYIPTEKNAKEPHPNDSGDPGWITFSSDGKKAYVGLSAVNAVAVIDTKTMEQTKLIPVGEQPDHVERVIIK